MLSHCPVLPLPGLLEPLWGFHTSSHVGSTLNHVASAFPGAHELEQMQLILETIPVIREEDKDELLRVMPSFISSTWEVKRPLRKLLPEVNSEGTEPDSPASILGPRSGITWGGAEGLLPRGPSTVPSHRTEALPGSQRLLGPLPD